MNNITFQNIVGKRYWIGTFALLISVFAWAAELMGAVYICPYCRVQRTVIGLLGIILLVPIVYHWLTKYAAIVIGFFGALVAANQHFMGWKKISAGVFKFNDNLLIDPFLLSGFALTAIIGLTIVVLQQEQKPT